jgi:hypothetical protein
MPKRRREAEVDQVETVPITIAEIVSDPLFGRGIDDYVAGRAAVSTEWNYERGRAFAAWCRGRGHPAPQPEKRAGGAALRLATLAFDEGALI